MTNVLLETVSVALEKTLKSTKMSDNIDIFEVEKIVKRKIGDDGEVSINKHNFYC